MKKIMIITLMVLFMLAVPAHEAQAIDDFFGYDEIKYRPGSIEDMLCPDGPRFVGGTYVGNGEMPYTGSN
jgi:hypothetical protein